MTGSFCNPRKRTPEKENGDQVAYNTPLWKASGALATSLHRSQVPLGR